MNIRLGEERATICKQLKRGVWSVESEGEIQTLAEQRRPDRPVCDQWQNGSNSEMMLTAELHRSFRRPQPSELRSVIIHSHIQKNATSNLT